MTGTSAATENSESGGSRQVSPQQHIYNGGGSSTGDHDPPSASLPLSNTLTVPGAAVGNGNGKGIFSLTSEDSLLPPHQPQQHTRPRHRIQFQRSRSASEIARLDAAEKNAKELSSPITNVDDNWPPSVAASRVSVKPSNLISNSRDTLQGGQFESNGGDNSLSEADRLRYSKSIPSSISKARASMRQSTVRVDGAPGSTIGALAMSIHKSTKQSSKLRRRLIFKNGDSNIAATNVHKMSQRYLADIFTTLVDMQWRWTILLFSSSFFVSWVFFAAIWWLAAYLHNDLVDGFPHGNINGTKPCVQFVNSFPTALLFSIETQHTIGYGFRHTTDECPHAIGLMMVQSVFSVLLQAFMAGIVFAKLSRPLKRAETLMFSKHAVICERDGRLCLLIRIGDMRKSHILNGTIRGLMVKKRETREGETLPLYQHNVELKMECGDQQIYLFWPLIACHVIDEDSPLYNISLKSLQNERFELIVILEGVVESTGMSTQAKTSYLPAEIKWGHRFTPLITYQKEDGTYQIDYRLFDETYDVETPMCSARELMEKRAEGKHIPMIKPVGVLGDPGLYMGDMAGTPLVGQNTTAGDTFKQSTLSGHFNPTEVWPAAPRASVMPNFPRNSSWFSWLRKRKSSGNSSNNQSDVTDRPSGAPESHSEMVNLGTSPPANNHNNHHNRLIDIERGNEENRRLLDEKLAHEV